MIRFTLTLISFFIFTSLYAQDNIIFRNGDEAKGKVLEITDELVKFKPADNPDGPVYSYKKAEIFMIKYENGKKDVFNEKQNITDYQVSYSASAYKAKSGESVFSFMFRTGWEYAHRVENSILYSGYSNPAYYENNFSATQNNFYLDILAGKRRKHYQFAGGIGFYFKDQKVHGLYLGYNNQTPVDFHTDFQGIGLALIFSNKIYLIDKKCSPFIMGDFSLAFDNVIGIKEGYPNYNYYGSYYYGSNITTHADLTFGGGIEIKTSKKYKLQIELGVKLKPESNDADNQSVFHTGLSFVF